MVPGRRSVYRLPRARRGPAAPHEDACTGLPARTAGRPPYRGYLSMSPTTKKNEPRIATMSETSVPGSSSDSTWMLL